jgi:lipopolysaccharide transport system permease protein
VVANARTATGSSHSGGRRAGHRRELELLLELTRKELRSRYKGSVLGYAWSVLNPLAYALVLFVAFKVIMRLPIADYALFLLSAMFAWQWFANSVESAGGTYVGNAALVKKVPFPRLLLPLAAVLNDAVQFAAALPVLACLALLYDRVPTLAWVWGLPLLIICQTAMAYGCALVVSSLNVFFRDVQRITGVAVQILFFLTPIIYSADMIPERYHALFWLNPMYGLVISYRSLFMDGTLPLAGLSAAALMGGALLAVGLAVHRRVDPRIPEAL